MAKKQTIQPDSATITITPIGGGSILFQGTTYLPGEGFICPESEAVRLIDMGVAVLAEAVGAIPLGRPRDTADENKGEPLASPLLDRIAAAQTLDELQSLCPEEKPSDEIIAAFQQRAEELAVPEDADEIDGIET